MATLVKEVYEALLSAGASEEKASRAAEVLTQYVRKDESDLATKQDIVVVRADIEKLQIELRMIKWVLGGLGFGILLIIFQNFALG